ncbi:MAG: anthranilate phosphoribosyltransferase [Burkholderiaceae bacterium]
MGATPRFDDAEALLRSVIQRVATGPELSKDIAREEARAALRLILDGAADPVQAGVLLIALRMKRESDDEQLGVLDAVLETTERVTAEVDELVDLADPYDGFARTLPVAPFLPALLAACGAPTIAHGVRAMGPKFGLTAQRVLEACGRPVDLTPAQAAARLAEPSCGWAYLDQRAFNPRLNALAELRTRIVKRQVLTTVEVLAKPLAGRRRSHLVTGYVHKPYPRIYALLARAAGFDSALIVRGIEGSVVPSLRANGRAWRYEDGGAEVVVDLRAADFGFAEGLYPPQLAATDHEAAFDSEAALAATRDQGLAALRGEPGRMRDNLVCAAATILWHLRRYDSLHAAAEAARAALDGGRAAAHFSR